MLEINNYVNIDRVENELKPTGSEKWNKSFGYLNTNQFILIYFQILICKYRMGKLNKFNSSDF